MKKIAILGSGAWAFALSQALVGAQVKMYSIENHVIESIRTNQRHPRFQHIEPVNKIDIYDQLAHAIHDSDLIIESVTSQGFTPVVQALVDLGCTTPLMITSKGINEEGMTLYEIAVKAGLKNVCVLSGATFADEVLEKKISCATLATADRSLFEMIKPIFNKQFFFLDYSNQPIACMLCGSMKNIYAILCGILEGLDCGKNGRASLITKAFLEIKSYLESRGMERNLADSFCGLADLILTCSSEKSRNFQCGSNIAKGMSVESARENVGMVVEGAFAAKAFSKCSQLPIAKAVYNILFAGYSPEKTIREVFENEFHLLP
jgi:glycerol-3-phosphate dehydrogenase (NAD(P)+)